MSVLVAGIVFGSNRVGYAQNVTCSLSAPLGPTTAATATGLTEPIAAGSNAFPPTAGGGTVRITCNNGGSTFTAGVGIFTISLGTPITNTTSHPFTSAAIRVSGGTGAFDTSGSGNVGISSVNNSGGTIVIGLGTPTATSEVTPTSGITFPASSTNSFDLNGVLVSMVGKSTLSASLSATGTGYSATPSPVSVISSVSAGLADPIVPTGVLPPSLPPGSTGGPALLKSNGTIVKGDFTIRIQENYAAMFREYSQFNGGGVFPQSPSSDVQIAIVFYNIPPGLFLSGCSATLTNLAGAPSEGFPTVNFTTVTSQSPVLTINFSSPLDLANVDLLWVTCTSVNGYPPLPPTSITAQVTLAPVGAALNSMGGPLTSLTTGQTPRYQQLFRPSTPILVATVLGPIITSILPSSGLPGDDIVASIFGMNLSSPSQVTFSGANITATILDAGDSEVQVEVYIAPSAAPGPRTVTVTTADGTSTPFSSFTVIGQVIKKRSGQVTSN